MTQMSEMLKYRKARFIQSMSWRRMGGNWVIHPLILNLGTGRRRGVNVTTQLRHPRERTRYPLNRRLGTSQHGYRSFEKKIDTLFLGGNSFCILFYSVCTSSVFVSLSWLSCIFPLCPYLQHTTQTSMPPAGFEPATPAGERPQNYAIDRATTGIDNIFQLRWILVSLIQLLALPRFEPWTSSP